MAKADQQQGDLVCAELLRAATELQVAIWSRMDGEPAARRDIAAAVEKIARHAAQLRY